jgi:hypothetical protein
MDTGNPQQMSASSDTTRSSPWVQRKDIGEDSVLVNHETETKGGEAFLKRLRATRPLFQDSTSSEEQETMIWSLLRSTGSFFTPRSGHEGIWIKLDDSVVRAKIRSLLCDSPHEKDKGETATEKAPRMVLRPRASRASRSEEAKSSSESRACRVTISEKAKSSSESRTGRASMPKKAKSCSKPRREKVRGLSHLPLVPLAAKELVEPLHRSCLGEDSILCGNESSTVGGQGFLALVQQLRPQFLEETATGAKRGEMINEVIRSSGTFYMKSSKLDFWVEVEPSSVSSKIVKALSYLEKPSDLEPCRMVRSAPHVERDVAHRLTGFRLAPLEPKMDAQPLHKSFLDHRSILCGYENLTMAGAEFLLLVARRRSQFLSKQATQGKRLGMVDEIIRLSCTFYMKSPLAEDDNLWIEVDRSGLRSIVTKALLESEGTTEAGTSDLALVPLEPKHGAAPLPAIALGARSILCDFESTTLGGTFFLSLVNKLRPQFQSEWNACIQRLSLVDSIINSCGTFYMQTSTSNDDMWVEAGRFSVSSKIAQALSYQEPPAPPTLESTQHAAERAWVASVAAPVPIREKYGLRLLPLSPKIGANLTHRSYLDHRSIMCGCESKTLAGMDFLASVDQLRPQFLDFSTSQEERLTMIKDVVRGSGTFFMNLSRLRDDMWVEASRCSVGSRIAEVFYGDWEMFPCNAGVGAQNKAACQSGASATMIDFPEFVPDRGAKELHRSFIDHRAVLCGCENETVGGQDFRSLVRQLRPLFRADAVSRSQRYKMVDDVIRASGAFYMKSPTLTDNMWVEASRFSVCSTIVTALLGNPANKAQDTTGSGRKSEKSRKALAQRDAEEKRPRTRRVRPAAPQDRFLKKRQREVTAVRSGSKKRLPTARSREKESAPRAHSYEALDQRECSRDLAPRSSSVPESEMAVPGGRSVMHKASALSRNARSGTMTMTLRNARVEGSKTSNLTGPKKRQGGDAVVKSANKQSRATR